MESPWMGPTASSMESLATCSEVLPNNSGTLQPSPIRKTHASPERRSTTGSVGGVSGNARVAALERAVEHLINEIAQLQESFLISQTQKRTRVVRLCTMIYACLYMIAHITIDTAGLLE